MDLKRRQVEPALAIGKDAQVGNLLYQIFRIPCGIAIGDAEKYYEPPPYLAHYIIVYRDGGSRNTLQECFHKATSLFPYLFPYLMSLFYSSPVPCVLLVYCVYDYR